MESAIRGLSTSYERTKLDERFVTELLIYAVKITSDIAACVKTIVNN